MYARLQHSLVPACILHSSELSSDNMSKRYFLISLNSFHPSSLLVNLRIKVCSSSTSWLRTLLKPQHIVSATFSSCSLRCSLLRRSLTVWSLKSNLILHPCRYYFLGTTSDIFQKKYHCLQVSVALTAHFDKKKNPLRSQLGNSILDHHILQ